MSSKKQNQSSIRRVLHFGALTSLLAASAPALADGFALVVSPPRFELSVDPGDTVRAVAELSNRSSVATQLNFATAEWELTAQGVVALKEVLKSNSCRPWVAIERRQMLLEPGAKLRYRFEVSPPPGTQPTECRFAIVISGGEEQASTGEGIEFGVQGQIALIVYVAVGDVKPALQIVKADVVEIQGVQTPVLMVENTGDAHGRLAAFLSSTDANGKKRELRPSTLPILPGETRMIALNIDDNRDAIEAQSRAVSGSVEPDLIAYPLEVTGTISDTVNSFSFEGVFEP